MRRFIRYTAFFLLLVVFTTSASEGFAAKKKSKAKPYRGVTARAAILSDATQTKRLYSKNVHLRVPPASTTKVMTALLVLEKLPLDKYVTVSKRSTLVQPSKLYLKSGEQYKVKDLLYAILLSSSNDASVVLAEAVAGSEWKFVQMMNKRAKELGAKNTKFLNSHGLPSKESQYTTPYDMYLIFKHALKKDFFQKAISLKRKAIYSKGGRKHNLLSHNKILFKDWKQAYFGKTGYTRAAKSCFVGYTKKGNRTLIIAVFGCTRRWEDIKFITEKYGGVDL